MPPSPEQQAKIRAASKKYYDANKAAIAERRKAYRQLNKATPTQVDEFRQTLSQVKDEVRRTVAAELANLPAPVAAPVAAPAAAPATTDRTYEPTLEGIVQLFKDKIENHKARVDGIRSLFKFFNTTSLKTFKTSKVSRDVINRLDNSHLAVNSRIAYITSLLKAASLYEPFKKYIGNPAYVKYDNYFKKLKLDNADNLEEKRETEVVPDWAEYKAAILRKYGVESKEYALVSIFDAQTLRDNFDFVVVKQPPANADKNYILIPNIRKNARTGAITKHPLTLYLNKYKTSGGYGSQVIELPQETSNIVRKYAMLSGITEGALLFEREKLGQFISKMNAAAGYPGITLNTMRKMKSSMAAAASGGSNAAIVAEANRTFHSPETAKRSYIRKVKKD
jgi:hypothetical protein